MKKIIAVLMFVAAFASCSLSYDGDGSKDTPYVIYNHDDFSALYSELNGGTEKYYVLSCDLQLTSWGELIAPIYTAYGSKTVYDQRYDSDGNIISGEYDEREIVQIYTQGTPFTGHFDGQGHNIYIKLNPVPLEAGDLTYYMNSSLFGAISADNSSDYAVKNLNVGGSINGGFLGAGLTSTLYSGKIEGCTVSCDIVISTITGDEDLELHMIHAGGIAANMYGGQIKSCDFSGNITTSGGSFFSYAGGIVGAMAAGKIEGCKVRHYSIIKAEGDSDSERAQSAGGIVGYLEVDDLYANDSQDVTVTYCEFEGGEITGGTTAGGIVGTAYGGLIAYNLVSEDARISAGNISGGIVGRSSAGAAVYNNDVMGGYVQADSRASGGIVGLLELGEVRENYSQASVRGDAVSQGGVIGEIHNHYGTTDNVTGNSYMGSGYAIGLDEHMNVNIDGENTRLDPVLYFEGSATLTQATENVQYREAITVSLPAVVDLTPIPSWLNPVQNGSTITLSGIPTETGTSTFTLTASYGYQTLSRTFSITVTPRLLISADSYVTAKIGDYVEIPLSVYANDYDISNASFTWSLEDGSLPSGLSLDETGSISGYAASPGTYDVTVQVTPENISLSPVTRSITIDVEPEITITTDTLTSPVKAGREYSCAVETDSSLPILWSLSNGTLPDGLILGAFTGYISGTPTTAGEYTFTLMASTGTASADKEFTLTVEPAISITTASILPYAFLGEFYSQDISHDVPSGNSIQWTLSGADFPKGLSFDSGTISGVVDSSPDVAGDYAFNVKISTGAFADSRDFELKVVGLFFSPDTLPSVIVGNEYSHDLRDYIDVYGVSEDLAFFTADAGDIPSGLSLDEDGLLYGTPQVSGTYTFPVSAVLYNFTVEKNCVLNVLPMLSVIVPDALPSRVKAGEELSPCLFTVSPDISPVTWSLSGSYPDGLTLGSLTGQLSGKVSTAGVYTFAVQATYGATTAESELTLTVDPALTITTSSPLPYAFTGSEYSLTLSHDAPAGNTVTWEKVSGDLPDGFTLSSDGTISGISDTARGYEFVVAASAGYYTASKDLILNVIRFAISTDKELPSGIAGSIYPPFYIEADCASADLVTWSADVETLPDGLVLSADGMISGTPTTSGTYTFTVFAISGDISLSKDFTLTVYPALSVIVPDALPSRVKAGDEILPCVFTVSPDISPVTWALSGSYPDGLTLGSLTGQLSGKVSTAGVYTFTVQATYGATTAESELTLTVDPALTITTSSPLPYAFTGSEYSLTLSHDAPAGNTVTWEKVSGDLPDGFTLSSDGTISGISDTARGYEFVVAASAGTFTVSKDFTLTVIHFVISSDSELKGGVIGEKYSFDLKAVGAAENLVTWSADNSLLPSGLELSSSGRISGTPTTEGSYTFRAFASSGDIIISKDLSITIYPALEIIEPENFPARFKAGQAFSYTFSTDADNPENIYWSVSSGSLPDGLLLGNLTGEIVGTPTQSGTYTFTVQASNGAASSSYTMTLIIDPVLTITTASTLPYAFTGSEYSLTLSHDAPAGNTVTWEKVSGDLPNGFTLNTDGTLSGLTNDDGEYTFTVKASAGLYTDSKDFTLTVLNVTLSFDTVLPDAAVSRDYSHHFQAHGVSANLITWSADLGAIPEGLTFYTSGLLAGTPKESGSYSFLVSALSGDITVSGYAKIDVLPFFNVAILTDRLPDATVNTRYSQVLSYDAPSGYAAKWEKVSGDLPLGFTLSEGGIISGITSRTGSYSFRLKLTAGLTVSKDFTLRVLETSSDKESVVIMSASLPDGVIGEEYRAELIAVPETASWSNSGGITPPGLTLSADGVISGVPSVAGDFYFYATASHESYNSSTREYSIHIASSKADGETSGSSGGGGGCNSGGMIFLAGMLMFLRRKK